MSFRSKATARNLRLALSIACVGAAYLCLSIVANGREISEWLLGRWIAQGRGTVSVHGDMEVLKDKIFWEHHGWVKYRIVSESDSYVLVELEREVGCGNVHRFEPDPSIVEGIVALRMRE